MFAGETLPIWLAVGLCGMMIQLAKLLAYSVARRRIWLAVLGQSYGLPSLPGALLTCLMVVVGLRMGWNSSEFGVVLVFAIIFIHDSVKLGFASRRHREAVFHLVLALQEGGRFRLRVADYLDPRTHHPAHVLVGMVLGGLFALAFGVGQG
ncbi:MAG: divergent PAP2 family protein [Gemmatimonadales bacterium]|nr:divergent PAP2 family protein [Gemmatimonadales bacterium]